LIKTFYKMCANTISSILILTGAVRQRWSERMEGIVGFTKLFREEMSGLPEGSIIIFTGSSAVCAPFAELLAYSIRDKKFEIFFSPIADDEDCRALIWQEGTGFGISPTGNGIKEAAAIVVLGGLAMPKFGCPTEKVQHFIEKTSKPHVTKVIGVCFMDIFKRSGWDLKIKFDALINATLETEKQI
jgi:hypothetical protein